MLNNLEQQLFSSRKVREFLKHFSETQQSRVLKACVIMGIQELERTNQIQNLSCQHLEDIVVQNEASLRSENTAPSGAHTNNQSWQEKMGAVAKGGVKDMMEDCEKQPMPQPQQQRQRTNSLPIGGAPNNHVVPQMQAFRRGGRPSQAAQISNNNIAADHHQPQHGSARGGVPLSGADKQRHPGTSRSNQGAGTGGNSSTAFNKPYFIQGLTATVTSRQQKAPAQVVQHSHENSIAINDSLVEDLATFGDHQFLPTDIQITPSTTQNHPTRSSSVPRNLQDNYHHQGLIQHALPQEPNEQSNQKVSTGPGVQQEETTQKVKGSGLRRGKREPNFSKIGDREHEKRVQSEQARIGSRPQAGRPSTQQSNLNNQVQQNQQLSDVRRPRNLLPAQMSLQGQRAKSLNPLIYPAWWGDGDLDEPKKNQNYSPKGQPNTQQQVVPVMTEQPRIRNQMYRPEAYVNTMSTEQTLDAQAYQHDGRGMTYPNQTGSSQNTFQMAAQRQYTETSVTHNSSTMSLVADALQQARATADRLQRDLAQSKRHRAQLMQNNQEQHKAVQQQVYVNPGQNDPMIVDIRNEEHIRQHQAMQANARQQRRSSRNSQKNAQFGSKQQPASASQRQNFHAGNQENFQRNGSHQQMYSRAQASNVVLQHSPPRTTKTQEARQKYNSQMVRNRAISQNKDTSSGPLPSYLKGVTSKIRDQVQQDKMYSQNTDAQPIQIFVPPPPQTNPKHSSKQRSKRQHKNEHKQVGESSYQDSYGRLVKLKYQHSDMNQQYAHDQHNRNLMEHQQQYFQQQVQDVEDPAIIKHQEQYDSNHRNFNGDNNANNVDKMCNDLLDSPYVQKFAAPNNNANQYYYQATNAPDHIGHYQVQQRAYDQNVHGRQDESGITSQQDQNDDSTIQTNHLQGGAMSNGGAPLSQHGATQGGPHQHHMFSVENSSSMVMYNATVRNQNTNMKTDDTSAAGTNNNYLGHGNDINNFQLSNGNQILFDSKAFDGLPSQLHQINSQTAGAGLGTNGNPSSHNNLTTLNNQPFSVEGDPTISASSNCQTEEKYKDHQQYSQGQAFQSAGFGGAPQHEDLHQQYLMHNHQVSSQQSQQRMSDYQAENKVEQHPLYQNPPPNQDQQLRNQTGYDLQQLRQKYQQPQPPNDNNNNLSRLMERVDMTSEESKIMTFKTNNQESQVQQKHTNTNWNGNQFEGTGTQGGFDKRGSLNTLSQMTNPFRTGIYNNQATMMSQSEVMTGPPNRQRTANNYYGIDSSKLQDDDDQFSSPEENKTMQQEPIPGVNASMLHHQNVNNGRQETDHDPSSSEISGYDLKGMLNRVRNQANYVHNNVLKNSAGIGEPNKSPSDQYDAYGVPRHQHTGSGFSHPSANPDGNNGHQFMSQNIPAGDQTPFTAHALSHVVSQQNPVSALHTAGQEAPSSYHPVVSQDFNPLKTTLGKDEIPNQSSGIVSNEESKKPQLNPNADNSSSAYYQFQPAYQQQTATAFQAMHQQQKLVGQQNMMIYGAVGSHRSSEKQMEVPDVQQNHQESKNSMNAYLMANKKSAKTTDSKANDDEQQNETTVTDDLSDYSSSAQELASQNMGQKENHESQSHQMPKQLTSCSSSKKQSQAMPQSSSQLMNAPQVQNFVQPPLQIHQQISDQHNESNAEIETRMQEFLKNQNEKVIQAQQRASDNNQATAANPNPQKAVSDDSSSDDDDDDDLSSGSGLTGTDTSGIDTSSMSQSMRSSINAANPVNNNVNQNAHNSQAQMMAANNAQALTSMPRQLNNQYPAMAFNHPKYSNTFQKQQQYQ